MGVKEGPIDTSYSPSDPPWWKMISAESRGDEDPASGLRGKGNGAEANTSAGEMVLYGVGAEGGRYEDVEVEVDVNVDVDVEVEVDLDAVEKKDSTPAPAPAREAGGGRRGVVGSCDSGGIGVVSDGGSMVMIESGSSSRCQRGMLESPCEVCEGPVGECGSGWVAR